jgi:hypothetical protein
MICFNRQNDVLDGLAANYDAMVIYSSRSGYLWIAQSIKEVGVCYRSRHSLLN